MVLFLPHLPPLTLFYIVPFYLGRNIYIPIYISIYPGIVPPYPAYPHLLYISTYIYIYPYYIFILYNASTKTNDIYLYHYPAYPYLIYIYIYIYIYYILIIYKCIHHHQRHIYIFISPFSSLPIPHIYMSIIYLSCYINI